MILTKENIKQIDPVSLADEYISSGRLDELLVIVPTNRKLRSLKKELVSRVPGKAATVVNVETLTTITSSMLEKVFPFTPLSEAASTLLIEESLLGLDLKYFSAYRDGIPQGTLEKIKNVISEYKRHGITPGRLKEEAALLEKTEKTKALDIASIYENFREKCIELKTLDVGDIYNLLLNRGPEETEKIFRRLYPAVQTVIVNGFDEFSTPESMFLDLLSGFKDVKLYIDFDYYRFNPMIFSHLDDCYQRLESLGFQRAEDISPAYTGRFRTAVREKLFLRKNDKKFDLKESITGINAPSREEEIAFIAREIKTLITEKKAEPHKICVAFNLIPKYSPVIRHMFEKYGIPYNLTDRLYLNRSYPVTAIISFLEIAENDFYYRNIMRALSSGFIELPGIDAANLKRSAAELKIVSGRNNWLNILKSAILRYERTGDSDEPDAPYKLARYRSALEDIEKIYTYLVPFREHLDTAAFRKELDGLIVKLGIPYSLLRDSGGKQEENVKAVTIFLESIDEVFELLSRREEKGTTHSLGYYLDILRTVAGWTRFNVKEKPGYGVQVTNVNEIRGLNFDYLFLAGMNDGEFPTRYSPEIFFSGSFASYELKHQTEERYHFYQVLCSWNKHLYLSAPYSGDNRELVESSFLKDFRELFDYGEKSADAFGDTIYSGDDLLVFAGREGLNKVKFTYRDTPLAGHIDFDYLDKAAAVENLRSRAPFEESVYNGYLLSDFTYGSSQISMFDTENTLSKQASEYLSDYSKKEFSVSRLETYAKCPHRFFLQNVLRVETVEEPSEEMEAVELGSILHTILFRFYISARERGIVLRSCSDAVFDKAVDMIYKIAAEVLEEDAFDYPAVFHEREKILGFAGNRYDSILYRFLEAERNDSSDETPSFFEVAFGSVAKGGTDPEFDTEVTVEIGENRLRGKIDRIELNKEKGTYSVTDYKTGGKKPTKKEIEEGLALQLPVYLYAAGKLLEENSGTKPEPRDMSIFSLKYNEKNFGKTAVNISRKNDNKSEVNEEVIKNSLSYISEYILGIREGKFPLSPLDNRENIVCRFCEFKPVCRVAEIKIENED